MGEFFTTQSSQPIVLGLAGYLFLWTGLVVLFLLTLVYQHHSLYRTFFKGLQWVQIVFLYGWYLLDGFPLVESLPLYHCRVAMFSLLLLPNSSSIKDFFAFLGLGGVLAALVYPVFDPYGVFHVTFFSYVIGHYALFVNALLYLLAKKSSVSLSFQKILLYTMGFHVIILMVNQLTGGNYGFLRQPPLLGEHSLEINFLVVTALIVSLVTVVQHCCRLMPDSWRPFRKKGKPM